MSGVLVKNALPVSFGAASCTARILLQRLELASFRRKLDLADSLKEYTARGAVTRKADCPLKRATHPAHEADFGASEEL